MVMMRIASVLTLTAAILVASPAVASDRPMTPREIYKKEGKSVVLVFGTDGSAQGSAGTGSIITKDGQVITNAHVVAKNGRPYRRLFIYLKPDKLRGSMKYDLKRRYKATLVDVNPDLDLALLRIVDPPSDLKPIRFVNPDDVEIGEPVVAIGHPETGGLWTLTTGSISSVVADFNGVSGKDVFQTEASVNRGNSGGPLLNAWGQMVGINTCISRKAADGLAITDINFSLKSNVAVDWLKRRKLMNLAYAKPGQIDGGIPNTALASNTKKPAAAKPKKTVSEGKTVVAIVEPDRGEEVADDPEFAKAAKSSHTVSRNMKGQAKTEKVATKHLTKNRPYEMDGFVSARVKEIRALEQMMDEMRGKIDRRRHRKSKRSKFDAMGL